MKQIRVRQETNPNKIPKGLRGMFGEQSNPEEKRFNIHIRALGSGLSVMLFLLSVTFCINESPFWLLLLIPLTYLLWIIYKNEKLPE